MVPIPHSVWFHRQKKGHSRKSTHTTPFSPPFPRVLPPLVLDFWREILPPKRTGASTTYIYMHAIQGYKKTEQQKASKKEKKDECILCDQWHSRSNLVLLQPPGCAENVMDWFKPRKEVHRVPQMAGNAVTHFLTHFFQFQTSHHFCISS